MQRLLFVDWMRTTAIFFMVLCHSVIYWSWPDNNQAFVYFFANHIIGDFAAPLFLFLVGLSSHFSQKNSKQRGIIIFVLGLVFALLARGPHTVFDWDILPLIGCSLVVLGFVKKYPTWILCSMAICLISAAPFLRDSLGYLDSWGKSSMLAAGTPAILNGLVLDPLTDYQPHWTLVSILQGFLFQGYFPIFPWLALPLMGLCVGRYLQQKVLWALIGVLFVGSSLLLTPWSFYPDNTGMLLLQLGFCLCLLFALRVIQKPGISILFSRYSLTIYILHHFFLLWTSALLGGLHLMPLTALYSGGLLLLALYGLCHQWDKIDGKYSFEWLLNRIQSSKTQAPLSIPEP